MTESTTPRPLAIVSALLIGICVDNGWIALGPVTVETAKLTEAVKELPALPFREQSVDWAFGLMHLAQTRVGQGQIPAESEPDIRALLGMAYDELPERTGLSM